MKHYGWETALVMLLIAEVLLFALFNPNMLNIHTLLYSTSDFICIGLVALPLTLVIASGGIDISFGAVIGLCAVVLGILHQEGMALVLAVPLTLMVGVLCGVLNGVLIVFTGINPLVITLGTMYLFSGAALLLSGVAGATGYEGIGGFPEVFTDFSNLLVLGIPMPLMLFLLFMLLFSLLLHRTYLGRNIILIGQSSRVARYNALPITRIQCMLYMFTGFLAAIAALVQVSYFGSARADLGATFLMPAITAVVLGGASIYGGSGSIPGTAVAVLLIGYLQQGLQMVGIPNQISGAFSGALLIVVVIGRTIGQYRHVIYSRLWRYQGSRS